MGFDVTDSNRYPAVVASLTMSGLEQAQRADVLTHRKARVIVQAVAHDIESSYDPRLARKALEQLVESSLKDKPLGQGAHEVLAKRSAMAQQAEDYRVAELSLGGGFGVSSSFITQHASEALFAIDWLADELRVPREQLSFISTRYDQPIQTVEVAHRAPGNRMKTHVLEVDFRADVPRVSVKARRR